MVIPGHATKDGEDMRGFLPRGNPLLLGITVSFRAELPLTTFLQHREGGKRSCIVLHDLPACPGAVFAAFALRGRGAGR